MSGTELVNEAAGILQLRPGLGKASEYSPGASAANFRLNVEFSNPFHPEFSPWNYGVKFRNDGHTFQMFMLDHNGNLNQVNGVGTDLDIIRTVPLPNMLTSGGALNHLVFLIVEEKAFILLNEALIGVFDVDEPDRVGEISLVTDVFNQTTVVGASTEFFDLVINSAGLIGFSDAGDLVRQTPDEIALGKFSLQTSATYTQATFISPINAFSGDFSYGLVFRTEAIGIDNWLVFNDSKQWQHVRISDTGAQTTVSSGTAEPLQTGQGDENLLEFVSTGDQHKVYLNGEFVTNMTLPPSDIPFAIAPAASFEPHHQAGGLPTQYRDFNVWSVEE